MGNFTQGIFSKAQAITGSAVLSTDYIDLGSKGDAIGNELYLDIDVDVAFTVGDSLKIDLVTDSEVTFTNPTVLMSLDILTAALTLDKRLFVGRLPLGCDRYISLKYTPTGTFSTGKINAKLTYGTDFQIV